MKYKVGDTVQIKNKKWYYDEMDLSGNIWRAHSPVFNNDMSKLCGKIGKIKEVLNNYYILSIDDVIYQYGFCDWALKLPYKKCCEYCENEKNMIPVGNIYVKGTYMIIDIPSADIIKYKSKIKYCPICGEKLYDDDKR